MDNHGQSNLGQDVKREVKTADVQPDLSCETKDLEDHGPTILSQDAV